MLTFALLINNRPSDGHSRHHRREGQEHAITESQSVSPRRSVSVYDILLTNMLVQFAMSMVHVHVHVHAQWVTV